MSTAPVVEQAMYLPRPLPHQHHFSRLEAAGGFEAVEVHARGQCFRVEGHRVRAGFLQTVDQGRDIAAVAIKDAQADVLLLAGTCIRSRWMD
jgi:redox-sensitive bicupin YhaK (pirin superfamily)